MLSLVRLAWRSLWRNTRRTFITVFAITFALALAVFFVAFAEGVYADLINQAVRLNAGHVTLQHPDYLAAPAIDLRVAEVSSWRQRIESLAGIERTKALVLGQGVAQSSYGAVGVALVGIEPQIEILTSPLARNVVQGHYLTADDPRGALIGRGLARRLKIQLGDKLVLTSNDVHGEIVGHMVRVTGIFATGADEIDGYLEQVPIDFARQLFSLGGDEATQIGVILTDADDQPDAVDALRAMVRNAPVVVLPWQEVLPEVAAYIRVDSGSNWVMQALLIFLSLFTIFNTILMSVLERTREFAMLIAIGTHPRRLRAQVILESTFLGVLGTLVGLAVGGLAGYYLEVYGFDFASMSDSGITVSGLALSTRLYARVTPGLLVGLGLTMLTATVLSGMLAVRRIARLSIATVLR